ncbi:MAG TPA: hypothetical protein HPP66_00720 [Planctomycetes bacterium]|nr:hypothetical protein [Planctomycetota bacterium]
MTERGIDNMPVGDNKKAEQVDDEFIPADAWPVCFKCLKPCHPLQYYCDSCDSNEVINPLASYMPFVRIRFTCGFCGDMWRKVLYDKEASIILWSLCLFLTFVFAPVLIIVGLPLFFIGKIENPKLQRTVETVFYILLAALLIIFFTLYYLSH